MNKNSTNNRKSPKVVSKYFTSSPVMDESLSEFKEKKTGYTGPKSSKPIVNKVRAKRAPKRIKGQKDIRTAISSKKNELVAYTKEFNKVCRKSGIDVDSEQLQLAIALSKSVQSAGDECSRSQETKILNSKERTGRIRTTLQEYGFTVPHVTIINNKRQKKKIRKNYKLLLATDAERQQIIGNKFSQILFENVCNSNLDNEGDFQHSNVYCMSTSISYNAMKNNDLFYVENLLARSYSNGRLLRDWGEIPGRPQSPRTCQPFNMNFSEIECSQEELDIVLSGTLKSARSIVQSKVKAVTDNAPIIVIDDCVTNDTKTQTINKTNALLSIIEETTVTTTTLVDNKYILDTITDKLIDATSDPNNSYTLDRVRSYSPDIFDDEASAVWDNSKVSTENCEQSLTKINKCDLMDLTQDNYDGKSVNADRSQYSESVGNNNDVITDLTGTGHARKDSIEKNNCKEQEAQNTSVQDLTEVDNEKGFIIGSQSTHLGNFTRRKSNDLMEITECVAVATEEYSSKKCSQFKNITKRNSNDLMEITECVGIIQCNSKIQDNIDLTQNVEEHDHVILVDAIVNSVVDKVVDLSQSSHSEDELPFVQISGSNNQSLDDTVLLNIDEIQSHKKSCNGSKAASQSFYDDFEYDHSHERSKETSDVSTHNNSHSHVNNNCDEIDLTQSNFKTSICFEQAEVDLTQSSNSSSGSVKETPNKLVIESPVINNLGKKDEVSIDYVDLFDDIAKSNTNSITDISSLQSSDRDLYNNNENVSENCSQNSQVFNISDKELEYSINKSRNDFVWDVNFGGISVMDNMLGVGNRETNCNKSHDAHNSMNKSMSDSYLPMVMVKKINIESNENNIDESDKPKATHPVKENDSTPCKAFARNTALVGVNTPKSNEYIIKTDQVTPMQDYASMSTPERNRELDKYGLKPFKRKRAIQLLTHLYNQTHPVVESCQVDDAPSPSKKRKHSTQLSPINPLKTTEFLTSSYKMVKSPNKNLRTNGRKSPKKCSFNEMNLQTNEIDIYEVTNELPDVRDVKCSEEDWVFQKREKAKLHSCRVPLHIALHNYVSCRRRLREAILKYEPVNIDIIHKELVASGFRYDPKDLLKYLDKKCITVKTADNNARSNKR